MQLEVSIKEILLAVIVSGILIAVTVVFILPGPLPMLINLASLSGLSSINLPVRLIIPEIKINTALEYVSVKSDGSLGTPKDLTHAAWFNLGPRPGQEGNAIIDGHYGWIKGVPAVFNDLYTLKPGSKIYIEDQKGNRISFVVREIKIYDKDEDASGVFTLSDGKAHLNLITCEGVWISALKTYSNRLVVFADKE